MLPHSTLCCRDLFCASAIFPGQQQLAQLIGNEAAFFATAAAGSLQQTAAAATAAVATFASFEKPLL